MMDLVKYVIFPDHSDIPTWIDGPQAIRAILETQMATIMEPQEKILSDFIDSLPEIGRLLDTDVEAVMCNDPAATTADEIILCYPVVKVMLHYRVAHRLHQLGVPCIPRMLTEMAHSETGIDIHPAGTFYLCAQL